MWWVHPGWMPGPHPGRCTTPLLSWTWERKYDEKGSWVEIRTGRDHSPSRAEQTGLGEKKLISFITNQIRVG